MSELTAPDSPPLIPEDERVLTRAGLNRRAELLFHAERLFGDRGFAGTRMVDIAEAAGVTKGNLYWYFDTKAALAREIAVEARTRLLNVQAVAIEGVGHPLDVLFLACAASVRFNVEESPLYSATAGVSDVEYLQELSDSSNVYADNSVRVLEWGRREGTVVDDDDLGHLARAIEGIVNHFSVLASRSGDVASLAPAAGRCVLRMIARDGEAVAAALARCEERLVTVLA